ncbi:MAG: glycosyltransferase family 2 protein [bacterium]|nr:glycosyltransferase family 2 protein [bacterium]
MEEKKTDLEKLISIIIINWNGERFLPACIGSVKAQSYGKIEIILVDNASQDNSLVNLPREVILIQNNVNKGFCAAANQGIKKSSGGIIILLNQDVTLDKDFVKNIAGTFYLNKPAGMVSGKIFRMDGMTIDSTGQFMNKWCKPVERGYNKKDQGQYDKKNRSFSVCGAAACYRREMLEDIRIKDEYFDENFFAFYEDLDLGWRAQLKGWKAFFDPGAVVYHYRGGTQNKNQRFQILGRPKNIQLKIIFNRYLMIIKNISMVHLILYFPFFLTRSIIDLFFVILFIRDPAGVFNEITLFKSAWKKRAVIQAGRSTPDKIIRKYII